MAEELILSVKSNVKSVTKDTEEYGKSIQDVEKKLENVNTTLKEQKDILIFLQEEEVRLSQKRANMNDYEVSMSGINKTLARTKNSIKDQKLALTRLTEQQREAKDAVKEYTDAQKEQKKATDEIFGSFRIFGLTLKGVRKAFGKIIPTAKLMFGTIKAGLISTGIGALLVAFGTLMAWFKKTKVGAEVLEKIFAGVGAAVSVIVDRIAKFGGAIAKLFSGDVKGAFSDMKGAFTGIGNEMLREISLAVALKAALQDLADSERALSVEMAQRRAEIEDLMLKANDLNLSEAERLQALEDAGVIERQLMSDRLANAEEAVRIQQSQMSMSDNLKEDLDELAQKEITLANIRRESGKMQRTLQTKMNRIKRQTERAEAAAHKKWKTRIAAERSYQNEVITEVNELIKQAKLNAIADEEEKAIKVIRIAQIAAIKRVELIKDENKTAAEMEIHKGILLKNIFLAYGQQVLDVKEDFKKKAEALDLEEQQKLKDIQNENLLMTIENAREKADKELEIAEKAELRENELRIASLEDKGLIEAEIEEKYRLLREEKKDEEAEQDKERDAEVLAAKVELLAKGLDVIKGFMDVQAQTLENNYKNEIKLAEANGKSTEGIEAKFAAKREEQAKKFKAMKIAMAIVDTYQSAVAAYANALEIPLIGTVMAPISAGLAIAAGLANVAMIEKQPLGGGGGGGGTGGGPTPQTPAPQMMSGAFTLGGGEAPDPVQAYVVTDDMTNNQNKLATIRRRATI